MYKLINKPATANINFDRNNPNPSTSWNSYRIFNLWNENSINLLEFIKLMENKLGIISIKKIRENATWRCTIYIFRFSSLMDWIGEFNYTSAKLGVKHFVNWYKDYYKY